MLSKQDEQRAMVLGQVGAGLLGIAVIQRVKIETNQMPTTRAMSIRAPPQIMCAICSSPPPNFGYPARNRESRTPINEQMAETTKTSISAITSVLRARCGSPERRVTVG